MNVSVNPIIFVANAVRTQRKLKNMKILNAKYIRDNQNQRTNINSPCKRHILNCIPIHIRCVGTSCTLAACRVCQPTNKMKNIIIYYFCKRVPICFVYSSLPVFVCVWHDMTIFNFVLYQATWRWCNVHSLSHADTWFHRRRPIINQLLASPHSACR